MKALENVLGHWVVHYRWWIIACSLLAIGLASSGAGRIVFNDDNRVYFGKENPQLNALEELENIYTKNENVLFVLAPGDGKVFTRETLAAIEELTNKAWQIPYSNRVDSISNFQHTYAQGDDLVVEDLVKGAAHLSDQQIARIKQVALHEPLLVNRLISPQGHTTGINVNVLKPGKSAKEVPDIAAAARKIKAEIESEFPHIKVYLNGGVMFANAFQEVSMEDMSTLVPLMYGILMILMMVLLRSFSGTFATLIIIGVSTTTALGLTGWLGISLNATSVNAPTIILTLAIADCIHILATMFMAMRRGMNKHQAVIESLRINTQPVILTSVTTAIGFLSMNFSDAPPFRDLGNIVTMGVMVAMVFSLTLLPAMLAVIPVRVTKVMHDRKFAMDRFGDLVVRYRKPLLVGNLVFIALAVAGLQNIQLDDNFIHYFDQRYKIRQAADFVQANLTGLDNIEYSLDSGEAGGSNDPAYLTKIEEFADWYRGQPKVTHVNVITDTIKRLNKNMHADNATYYRIPESRELAAQYMLMYEMSLPYGLDLNNQVNVDKSATRMVVTFANASSKELRAADERARAWLTANAPRSMLTYGASLSLMFAHISERNIDQMLTGTVLALLLISGVLLFALRSVKLGLISMVPNLVPAAMAFGFWGMFVGEVGLTIAVIGTMTLGIIVDDTVHFLSKYRRARNEHHLNSQDAVKYAFSTVGKALCITSVVLVAGFTALTFSGFKLNSDMGLMAAVAIGIALVVDFLFLPPLLMAMDKEREPVKHGGAEENVERITAAWEGNQV